MRPKDYPRPNVKELPGLYAELDRLIEKAEALIRGLPSRHFDEENETICFGAMTVNDLKELISKEPDTMVIAFTRVCGLSDREFLRLFGLKNVYKLRKSRNWTSGEDEVLFANSVKSLLPKQMHLETFLYAFYKMWEEHQKRHYRARFEKDVRSFFQAYGYDCEKVTHPTEVNGAIPPYEPCVTMQIRTGVRKDLVKRAKEFSTEFDESIKAFPNARFMVVFRIPQHELGKREEIRQVIIAQRSGRPYDGVFFQDELKDALKKLEEWNVPKKRGGTMVASFS